MSSKKRRHNNETENDNNSEKENVDGLAEKDVLISFNVLVNIQKEISKSREFFPNEVIHLIATYATVFIPYEKTVVAGITLTDLNETAKRSYKRFVHHREDVIAHAALRLNDTLFCDRSLNIWYRKSRCCKNFLRNYEEDQYLHSDIFEVDVKFIHRALRKEDTKFIELLNNLQVPKLEDEEDDAQFTIYVTFTNESFENTNKFIRHMEKCPCCD